MHFDYDAVVTPGNRDTEQVFRAVDQAVIAHQAGAGGMGTILAVLPEHHHLFRSLSKNARLLKVALDVSPDAISLDALRERAWQLVQAHYLERLSGLVDAYGAGAAKGQGATELGDIAKAAVAGRVATLLIEADRGIPGTIGATGKVKAGKLGDPHVDDLLDDLGELVLKAGGEVVMVLPERMPTRTGAAASPASERPTPAPAPATTASLRAPQPGSRRHRLRARRGRSRLTAAWPARRPCSFLRRSSPRAASRAGGGGVRFVQRQQLVPAEHGWAVDQQQACAVRHRHGLQVGLATFQQRIARRQLGGRWGADAGCHGLRFTLQHMVEQIALVGKVVVERAAGDAGCGIDVGRRGVAVPLVYEQPACRHGGLLPVAPGLQAAAYQGLVCASAIG